MAEKETADIVIDSGHSYGSWGCHEFVARESVWLRKREFGNHQSSGTEWEDAIGTGSR